MLPTHQEQHGPQLLIAQLKDEAMNDTQGGPATQQGVAANKAAY